MTTKTLAGDLASLDVTIANGQSVSPAAAIGGYHVVGILMPAAWTAAALSFQGSLDDVTFRPLFDRYGTEVSFTVAASRLLIVSPTDLGTLKSLKLQSGTSTAAVPQGQAATLTLLLKRYE